MKTPTEHPVTICLGDAFAKKIGWAPARYWAILRGQVVPTDEERALLVGTFYPRVRPDHFPLTAPARRSTLPTMPTGEIEQAQRGRPSPIRNHPLMKALRKAGVTVVEEAKRTKRSDASIRAYCFPPKSSTYRPVPRQLAEDWQERYGVPLSAWHSFTG